MVGWAGWGKAGALPSSPLLSSLPVCTRCGCPRPRPLRASLFAMHPSPPLVAPRRPSPPLVAPRQPSSTLVNPSTLATPASPHPLPSPPPPAVRGAGLPVPLGGHPPPLGRRLPHHLLRSHARPGRLCAEVRAGNGGGWRRRGSDGALPGRGDRCWRNLSAAPSCPLRPPRAACPSGGPWTRRRRRCAPRPSPPPTSRRSGPRTCTLRGWPTAAPSAEPCAAAAAASGCQLGRAAPAMAAPPAGPPRSARAGC